MCGSSVYITDDSNVAIFAGESGYFSCVDLVPRGHYEVHGDAVEMQSPDSSARSMAGLGLRLCALHFNDPARPLFCFTGNFVCAAGRYNKTFSKVSSTNIVLLMGTVLLDYYCGKCFVV